MILGEKMQDFVENVGFCKRKCMIWGLKGVFLEEKMCDFGVNGVFLERKCMILG